MSTNIRYPNITAADEKGQLLQVKSYLHQLAEQLNWALQSPELSAGSGSVIQTGSSSSSSSESGGISPATFSEIKSLIIKSADIVEAYYEEINSRLEGIYVAESEFGTFKELTAAELTQTSTSITQAYTNISELTTSIGEINKTLTDTSAYIKTGLLGESPDGVPIYGVEVGQRTDVNGEEVFNAYARFTANRLSFYDQNGNEVAYISDNKLYIRNVHVTVSFQISGFKDNVLSDKSVVTKWVGTGGDS